MSFDDPFADPQESWGRSLLSALGLVWPLLAIAAVAIAALVISGPKPETIPKQRIVVIVEVVECVVVENDAGIATTCERRQR